MVRMKFDLLRSYQTGCLYCLFACFVFNIINIVSSKDANNVCKTFPDYYNDLERNPNCFYNPDINATVQQIIERHGYPFFNYTVVTEDGYILSLFRIPHGKNSTDKIGKPVFLVHGLGQSSVAYVFMGNKSLAFNLADNGYDVWLANLRGCRYSNKHVSFNEGQKRYWNFSFHEIGIYDLPAQLNIITRETKQKIVYIGHSMGTSANFVYSSIFPETASRVIDYAISMAPIAYLSYLTTPAKILTISPLYELVKGLLELKLPDGSIGKRTPQSLAVHETFCLPLPIQIDVCSLSKYIVFGYDRYQQDPETLPVNYLQGLEAFSLKTLIHYAQIIRTGRFQKYSYGPIDNKIMYGNENPPEYNLSNINILNYFLRGNADPVATKKNTLRTYFALPKHARPFNVYTVKYKYFTHTDFTQAKDVKPLVNDRVLDFIKSQE